MIDLDNLTEEQRACIPDVRFELIPICNLVSNQDYQRDLTESHITDTARDFDLSRVIFSSFNHHSMLRMKKLAPSVPCGLLYEAALVRPWEYAEKLGMDAIHPHYSEVLLSPGECTAAHEAGIRIHTWTVNTPEDQDAVLKAGVDILITNYPDQALKRAALG